MKLDSLKESSLSRIHAKMTSTIVGTITAYRSEYTKRQNQQRNRSLLAKLMNLDYSVTAVKGSYIENYGSDDAREVSEHSYMVAPKSDEQAARLESDLIALGEEFDQDSVLIIINKQGKLVGTSHRENAWPSYGHSEPVGGFKGGHAAQFMSRVNSRAFMFEDIEEPGTINGKRGVSILAGKPWEEIEVD